MSSRKTNNNLTRELEIIASQQLAKMRAGEIERLTSVDIAERVADKLGLPTQKLNDKPWHECTESSQAHQSLRTLTPRHQEAARMRAAGVSESVISRELGVARKTVANWLQDPKMEILTSTIQAGRDQAASVAAERIRELQLEAVEVLADLLKPGTRENVRLNAARDLLDRGGNAMPKQVQVSSVKAELSFEEVLELRERISG